MVTSPPPGNTSKPQLTDEQKARAAKASRSLASFIDDITHALATGLAGALILWGSLTGWHIHIPYLPTAVLIFGAHLLVRHISAAAGKGWASGKFETELKNFLNSMDIATQLKSSMGAEDFAKAMGEAIDKDRASGDKRYM